MSKHEAIDKIIDQWEHATSQGNKDQILKNHSANAVIFDTLPPFQYESSDSYRASFDQWQPDTKDGFKFFLTDRKIFTGDDKAFVFGALHCQGETTDGSKINDVVRCTICLDKVAGDWKIVHQHVSMPANIAGAQV